MIPNTLSIRRTVWATALVGSITVLTGCNDANTAAPPILTQPTTAAPSPAPVLLTIVPSLGQLSAGAAVRVQRLGDAATVAGLIGANGLATVDIAALTGSGPLQVSVSGGTGITYFDEGTNSDRPFGATDTLRALLTNASNGSRVAVTPLTTVAARYAQTLAGSAALTAAQVDQANDAVRRAFTPSLPSLTATLPTLLNVSSGPGALVNSDAGEYALSLGALANVAATNGGDFLRLMAAFILDIGRDGVIDGQDCLGSDCTPVPNAPYSPGSLIADTNASLTALAQRYADAGLQQAAGDGSLSPRSTNFAQPDGASPSPAPEPSPTPAPTPSPTGGVIAEPGQGSNGSGDFFIKPHLAAFAGTYVIGCKLGTTETRESNTLLLNSDGSGTDQGAAFSLATPQLNVQTFRNGSTGNTSFSVSANGMSTYTVELVGNVPTTARVFATGKNYNDCRLSSAPTSVSYQPVLDLNRYAGSYTSTCTTTGSDGKGIAAAGAQTVRLSRAGVPKLGDFKLATVDIKSIQAIDSPGRGEAAGRAGPVLLSGFHTVEILTNRQTGAVNSFRFLEDGSRRASTCAVNGFSATGDEIETTDDGGLPANVSTLVSGFAPGMVGDYVLGCSVEGVMMDKRFSIGSDGTASFEGVAVTGPSAFGSLSYNNEFFVSGSAPSGFSLVASGGNGTRDAGVANFFELNFNAGGALLNGRYTAKSSTGNTLLANCTQARSGAVAGGKLNLSPLVGPSLARSEMLNCTRNSGTGTPTGPTPFSVASDGTITLGNLTMVAGAYTGNVQDGYVFNRSLSSGILAMDSLRLNASTAASSLRRLNLDTAAGTQRKTFRVDAFAGETGNNSNSTCTQP